MSLFPPVSNVDMETREGRKINREKVAILKFFMLFYSSLIRAQWESQEKIEKKKEFYSLLLSSFPERELEECPQEFQKLMYVKVMEMKKMAAGEKEMSKTMPREFDPGIHEFLMKYDMQDLIGQTLTLMSRKMDSRDLINREVIEKTLRQFEDDIRSGRLVILEEMEE